MGHYEQEQGPAHYAATRHWEACVLYNLWDLVEEKK